VESITSSPGTGNDTIRNVTEIHQNAYRNPKVANDLHFRVWTDSDIKGWKIKIPAFGSATSTADGDRAINVTAEKGAVPYCTKLKVEIALYLENWNEKRLSNIEWTRDTTDKPGASGESAKAAPDFGWLIEPAMEVAPGIFQHTVYICNDDQDEWLELINIGLLPADDYLDDISTLQLADFPIALPNIDLMPETCLEYTFDEYGLSDHIYGHFQIVDVLGDTVIEDWFDHPTGVETIYDCGDANSDTNTNVGDAVFVISYVFKGGPAPEPLCVGDANGDHTVNVGDAVWLISYVFKGGPPPVEGCCSK
jgi:hypothetical protein